MGSVNGARAFGGEVPTNLDPVGLRSNATRKIPETDEFANRTNMRVTLRRVPLIYLGSVNTDVE
jgi:hypothetical protein